MASTKETIAAADQQGIQSTDPCARSRQVLHQSRTLIEEERMLSHDHQQQPTNQPAQAAGPIPESKTKPVKRNKLVHKNRWLISADIIAALSRAGVDCNIVVPPLYLDMPGLTRH